MWNTIGFEKQKNFFENAAKSGSLSHAYLFTGQDMIGKKTFALEFANKLSNQKTSVNPDLMFIDPSHSESGQTINIEEIRRLKDFLSLSPFYGSYKSVIIDKADAMTVESQNALLKVLEEPFSHALIILITANPNMLLSTVISRCQTFSFFPASKEKIAGLLDGIKAGEKEKNLLISIANGRIGLIKKLIDNKSLPQIGKAINELGQLLKLDINSRLNQAQILSEMDKKELQEKVLYWLLYMRTRIVDQKAANIAEYLLNLYETIQHPQHNTRLALENFLIHI